MTMTRRPSALGELVTLRQAMDRLFEDSFVRPRMWATGSDASPLPLDITNTPDALVVDAALPGIAPDDVEITVEDGTLSIRAESRSERTVGDEGQGDVLMQEIRRGTVGRTVALPSGLEPDKATATFEHGVLRLRIPRAEAIKPRQIRISPTTQGEALTDGQSRKRADEHAANGNDQHSSAELAGSGNKA